MEAHTRTSRGSQFTQYNRDSSFQSKLDEKFINRALLLKYGVGYTLCRSKQN